MTAEIVLTAAVAANATSLTLSDVSNLPTLGTYTVNVEGEVYTVSAVTGKVLTVASTSSNSAAHGQSAVVSVVSTLTQVAGIPTPFAQNIGGVGSATQAGAFANILPPYKAATSISNATATLLPRTSAQFAKVRQNIANCNIFCVGDSTTAGFGTTQFQPGAYPGILPQLLSASGLFANYDSWMGGDNNASFTREAGDNRIVKGSGWSVGLQSTLGGSFYTASAATSDLSFTPTQQVDTFVLWYYRNAGFATISWKVNGGSTTNINTANASAVLGSTTISVPLGFNTLALNWVSGGNAAIIGVQAYNTTKKSVNVAQCGWYGSTTATWNNGQGVYGPLAALTTIAPDLTIINLGINNWNGGIGNLPCYLTDMQVIINAALAGGGEVVLMSPNPTGAATSLAVQQQFVDALAGLAASNNILFYDNWRRMGGVYTANNTNGLMSDTLHPNSAGYSGVANGLFNIIGSL